MHCYNGIGSVDQQLIIYAENNNSTFHYFSLKANYWYILMLRQLVRFLNSISDHP